MNYLECKIESTLGQGGQGVAFLVKPLDETDPNKYVYKVPWKPSHPLLQSYNATRVGKGRILKPRHIKTKQSITALTREKEYLRLVQGHDSIPLLCDLGDVDEVITRYEPASTLGTYILINLEQVLNSPNRLLKHATSVISWGYQICDALIHIQDNGFIAHRDVKPNNILVNVKENRAWLIDFGSALLAGDEDSFNRYFPLNCYTPPEGKFTLTPEPHQTSDVYSLGVVLYKSLSPYADLYDEDMILIFPGRIGEYVSLGIGKMLDELLVPMNIQDPRTRPTLAQTALHLKYVKAYLEAKH